MNFFLLVVIDLFVVVIRVCFVLVIGICLMQTPVIEPPSPLTQVAEDPKALFRRHIPAILYETLHQRELYESLRHVYNLSISFFTCAGTEDVAGGKPHAESLQHLVSFQLRRAETHRAYMSHRSTCRSLKFEDVLLPDAGSAVGRGPFQTST
ncbi:MAG: hypothetical protein J2P58_03630 [Acidimicrobiaceae bacterium]|nr:hypothetical protein [Acidimicrobiaceae bacterium]